MNCIVTAGPTYQPIDDVRRLTNFSTGRLGTELAAFLAAKGHSVTLLTGYYSIFRDVKAAQKIIEFSTPADLLSQLQSLTDWSVDAVFHAAAVGDFEFGKVWIRLPAGDLKELSAKKIPSRQDGLLVELTPTLKIISRLRQIFPKALIVGWKFETDGDLATALKTGRRQISENRTDACVLNGPAYGDGYGVLTLEGDCEHQPTSDALFQTLEQRLARKSHPERL